MSLPFWGLCYNMRLVFMSLLLCSLAIDAQTPSICGCWSTQATMTITTTTTTITMTTMRIGVGRSGESRKAKGPPMPDPPPTPHLPRITKIQLLNKKKNLPLWPDSQPPTPSHAPPDNDQKRPKIGPHLTLGRCLVGGQSGWPEGALWLIDRYVEGKELEP